MKPSFALIAATAALGAVLAGCGQPGPLYMPKPPAKPAPAAATPAAAPAPAPMAPLVPATPAPVSPPVPTQQ